MTTPILPPVDGAILAEILDGLPPRLRKRLDTVAQRAADWPLEQAGDDAVSAKVDDETTVTVHIRDGAVRAAADVHCNCLLAPACLHRAALIGLAPPLDADADAATGNGAEAATSPDLATTPTNGPDVTVTPDLQTESASSPPPSALTEPERVAAQALWDAGSALLVGGMIGASLFNEAQLRRAAHQARALGLYRSAALGTRVATGLRAARERRDDYSLAQLAADLRDLLLLARELPRATDTAALAELRGSGRRSYEHQGGLRLYGLFSEPVIARSGHAGVVTYFVDETGTLWTTADVMPGGADRVRPAYNTSVGVGGTVLTHRELTRGGLIVSGASASADGRLSSGNASRAVKMGGATWGEPPTAAFFEIPLEQQIERAFLAVDNGPDDNARAGADLVFARLRVLGPTEHGFAAVALSGESVSCVPPLFGYGLPYRDNLEALARPALSVRVIARIDQHRPATLRILAASPEEDQADIIALPPEWAGRINLGLDSLAPANIRQAEPASQDAEVASSPAITPLHLLRNRVEQAVAGGRIVASATAERDAARLRRSALNTASDLLTGLTTAAVPKRDAFGRTLSSDDYLIAWLAAAHYEAVASRQFLLRRWLRQ